MTPPRAAIYCRVSTSGQTVEPQLNALHAHAQAHGLDVVGVYADRAVSGVKARRPQLDRLLADAKRRRFDVVLVAKLDRLGRSLHHLLVVLGELEALGVDLLSVDDGLDTRTPVGRFFFQVRGAFAEYERALIVERTKAGLAVARRRGKRLGRPPVLDRRAQARVRRLKASGHSLRAIARTLSTSVGTVRRVLGS